MKSANYHTNDYEILAGYVFYAKMAKAEAIFIRKQSVLTLFTRKIVHPYLLNEMHIFLHCMVNRYFLLKTIKRSGRRQTARSL